MQFSQRNFSVNSVRSVLKQTVKMLLELIRSRVACHRP